MSLFIARPLNETGTRICSVGHWCSAAASRDYGFYVCTLTSNRGLSYTAEAEWDSECDGVIELTTKGARSTYSSCQRNHASRLHARFVSLLFDPACPNSR